MNKIILIGNLTKPPELRATPSGVMVCNFDIAVNDKRDGQDNTQYFRITAWRQLGENCAKYLEKGRKVFVSGPLTCRTYNASDGSPRYQLEVTADDIEYLSARGDDARTGQTTYPAPMIPASDYTPVETDELPF